MAIAEIEALGSGGNNIEPLVILARRVNGSNTTIISLSKDIVTQYKYAKLMTSQEYADYIGHSYTNSLPNVTSASWYTDAYVGEGYITLTTTAVDITALTLGDIQNIQSDASGDIRFAVKFYNE